jgi:DNA mismatch endonuclease, patch repair protein
VPMKADPVSSGSRSSPSFSGLRPASAAASRTKQRNRKGGTKAEMALRRAVWRLGLRYRLNRSDLPGNPDLVFCRQRIVVFVDGDFWHGREWERRKERLSCGSNSTYWIAKISYNRERDHRNNAALANLGWRVLRLWETDILKDAERAASQVEAFSALADTGQAQSG